VNDTGEITCLAQVTIDGTHERDLLPLVGAKFRMGREPRSAEEPHAGQIYMTWMGEMFGSGQGDQRLIRPHTESSFPRMWTACWCPWQCLPRMSAFRC